MMQFLEFTFHSFWRFCGMLLLLSIVVEGVVGCARALASTLLALINSLPEPSRHGSITATSLMTNPPLPPVAPASSAPAVPVGA